MRIKIKKSLILRLDIALLAIIILAIIGLTQPYLGHGEFWWTDEARHAMDGIYILDFLHDLPFSNIYTYTVEYFARYPALGFTWYLPFFAFVEGLVFSVAGFSEFSARLTVLLFLLVGITAWYLWTRSVWGSSVAFCSSLLIVTNSVFLLWSRSVMLEIPAFAMMILSIAAFDAYLRHQSYTRSLIAGLSIGAMLLTKQSTLLILPALAFYAVVSRNIRAFLSRKSLLLYLMSFGALAAIALHSILLGSTALEFLEKGTSNLVSIAPSRLLLETRVVWDALPGVVLLMAAFGLFVLARASRKSQDILILAWIISWCILIGWFSGSYSNVLRYTIYLTPAIALLACRLMAAYPFQSLLHKIWLLLLGGTILWTGFRSHSVEQPFVSGYEKAAAYVHTMPNQGPILFCCKNDGNFIFHVRRQDTAKDRIVLRADKLLVSMAVHKNYGIKSYVNDEKDIYEILDRYGVDLLILESRDLVGLPEFELLLQTAMKEKFALLQEIPVQSNISKLKDTKILVYRYLDRKPIRDGLIKFPMPHIGHDVRLPISKSEKGP